DLEVPGFRVVMPYISGAPYRDKRPVTLDDHVSLLRKFCLATHTSSEYLVGHSWGASIALAYAARYGGQVYAADPAIPIKRGLLSHCLRYTLEILSDAMHGREDIGGITRYLTDICTDIGVFQKQARAIQSVSFSGNLGGLMAYGSADRLYNPRDYEAFAAAHGLEIERVNGGHNWFLNQPGVARDRVTRFLTSS
ncbi:MAG: alpha/beta fold hydrolase, partial [Nanobdellota archaeon]